MKAKDIVYLDRETGKQSCRQCARRSVPGLVRGNGLCQYHYNAFMWGIAWADRCKAEEIKRIETRDA